MQSGETLATIALRFNLDSLDVAALNGVEGPDFAIFPGSVLWLSDDGQTVVHPGGNLIRVGKRLGLDWRDLADLNGIPGPVYVVFPGQVLELS